MDLGNPFETVVHYLLIRRMIRLDHWDGIPIMRALMYTFTYWTGLTMSHDIKLSGSDDFTELLCFIIS